MATTGLYYLRIRLRRNQQTDVNAARSDSDHPAIADDLDIRPAAFDLLASLRGVQTERLRQLFTSQDQSALRRPQ